MDAGRQFLLWQPTFPVFEVGMIASLAEVHLIFMLITTFVRRNQLQTY